MNKMVKSLVKILPIVMVAMIITTSVFGITPDVPVTNGGISDVNNLVTTIWSTVAIVIQILAIAAIIISGLRYMFAPADTKADIKQQTLVLVLGAILVFAAVPVAKFISDAAAGVL